MEHEECNCSQSLELIKEVDRLKKRVGFITETLKLATETVRIQSETLDNFVEYFKEDLG